MSRLVKLCCAVFMAVLFATVGARLATAQGVNDFVVNDFSGRYELFDDVNGGRMLVSESIDLTFSGQNRGILRAMPKTYQGKSLQLDVKHVQRDGSAEQYTTYTDNDNLVVKIGNPDATIAGNHTYTIEYEVRNMIRFYEDYSEFYWDINGDGWQQPFMKVRAEVILPNGEMPAPTVPSPECFTGSFGATAKQCRVIRNTSSFVFETTTPLEPQETLTVVVAFQSGVFSPRTIGDWLFDNRYQLLAFVLGIVAAAKAISVWWKHGKDHVGTGVIVPEHEPPKDLTPAEVGLMADYRVDGKDLTATIIDFAIRGYIRIHEETSKKLGLFKNRKFTLELLKDDVSQLKAHEQQLLVALFGDLAVGDKHELGKDKKNTLFTQLQVIHKDLTASLADTYGLIDKSPTKAIGVLVAVLIAAAVSLIVYQGGWGFVAGRLVLITAIVSVLPFMQRRSHAGVEAYEKIMGLKLYITTAEKDRLKMMQSVDRPYVAPGKTVELFEKLLPFAIALGVEKSWAKQFEGIYNQEPEWYSGNMSAFTTAHLASSIGNSVAAINTSFSAPSSSGGSGLSGGGGFSGGGGGGGGGGGW